MQRLISWFKEVFSFRGFTILTSTTVIVLVLAKLGGAAATFNPMTTMGRQWSAPLWANLLVLAAILLPYASSKSMASAGSKRALQILSTSYAIGGFACAALWDPGLGLLFIALGNCLRQVTKESQKRSRP
ncbi:hypothetical protein ATF69_1184 [Acidovorax delafieldii]|uniref:Uncharacterized protein n=1 Tax=Acidovorax delafieldii TaxID=47920 RepID=A0A561XT79_ACIDE|nr:hypothetical protein [Acidovorax delafieldii]TWG39316.1 hypothetical protein ATF69_1184 [Acidovorax delafieldii]